MVLIDTWWNVNLDEIMLRLVHDSFNRYMVECESFFYATLLAVYMVLIDTWWNVNLMHMVDQKLIP